ncbi:hypothetical protein MY4824_000365 [Beauveria thailandica]
MVFLCEFFLVVVWPEAVCAVAGSREAPYALVKLVLGLRAVSVTMSEADILEVIQSSWWASQKLVTHTGNNMQDEVVLSVRTSGWSKLSAGPESSIEPWDGKLPDIILGHGFRWRPKLSRYSWPGLWAMDEGHDGASDVTQLGHSFGSRDAGSLGAPMTTTFTSRPKL